jgi:hypothetical protein
MSEGIEKNEHWLDPEEAMAQKLAAALEEKLGYSFELTNIDGTYEIDTETFFLTFAVEPDLIELRSIEAKESKGVGGSVIRAVQELATEEGLTIIASNVLDTAVGFWQKMDFQPTNKDGEYIWEGYS